MSPITTAWLDYDLLRPHGERVFQLDRFRGTVGIPSIFR